MKSPGSVRARVESECLNVEVSRKENIEHCEDVDCAVA